ncbi:Cysteine-rich secretory protein family protein [Paraliobacillus sp. PM-2]|uniref:CAP domain-containing protein n=1 Tax=Paraliobacillus sp. PM-2 TaxID=1462524 RepID=UPI00061BA698|nr:CAP domain-containing protein [Paraliobacillus sp. PM-2]CQR46253.1 Cysteine-rich secretory protein family protein [Paraliobacillus sp. PM-2]
MKKNVYIGVILSTLIAVLFSLVVFGEQEDKSAFRSYAHYSQKNVGVNNITIDAENIVRFEEAREEQRLIEKEQERIRLEEERLEQERNEKEEEKSPIEEERQQDQEQERTDEQNEPKEAEEDPADPEETAEIEENEQQSNQSGDDAAEEESKQTTEEKQVETNYPGISSYAREVVSYTNMEREKQGLSKLTIDSKLSEVAWYKSKDMQVNNYFSHTSPTYGSPFDMMREFGVSYTAAGENIAMGYPDAKSVVNGWMNSEGHRKNILNENYTHIGVGFVKDGYYVTQMFRRK